MIKRLDNVKIPAGKGEDELYKLVKKKAGGRLGYFRILKKVARRARQRQHTLAIFCSVFA